MKKQSVLNIFGKYLWYRKGTAILFAVFAAIWGVIIALYDLPLEAWGYALLLCVALGLVTVTIGFFNFYKRYQVLEEQRGTIGITLENLPAPGNAMEERYVELLQILYQEKLDLSAQMHKQRQETMEYYTLWVHQVKTPIAAMRLLLQSTEHEQQEEIAAELFKIEQYIEMVLSYLRMDSDSTDYVIAEYDLDKMIRQAVRKYAGVFIRKKIKLSFQETNQKVLTDEKWLVFVIEQILSNALKYTTQGSITIHMEEASQILVIADTGIGIAEEDLPRIFEQGFTGYNGRWDKRSTGIGLYLCKRILGKLLHRITIESRMGEGTRVLIDLEHWQPYENVTLPPQL